jgi:DNA-binding PadR family transcriptional regulator
MPTSILIIALIVVLVVRVILGRQRSAQRRTTVMRALEQHKQLTGPELYRMTHLRSSILYPALNRLKREQLISGRFEEGEYPRQHYYQLTVEGRKYLASAQIDRLLGRKQKT